MKKIGIAIIGCGGISLQNHLPGLALCPNTTVVALCDNDPAMLERASRETGIKLTSTDYKTIVNRDEVTAVIIATPNNVHAPIALAAIAAGKHVLCEKPIAINFPEAQQMCQAAERAGVRHMSAFTYRFVPAMQYLADRIKSGFIGQPYHLRSCRLQDWGSRALGWRQVERLAGSGELGDMLSHRIDFAHLLYGKIDRLVANTRRFIDSRQGHVSDLEDWVALLTEFHNGATGVMESSKLATGRSESWRSQDYLEVNGSEGTLVFFTERWNELQVGRPGGTGLETIPVPEKFWKWPGSPRNVRDGNPMVVFRYDQNFEFIDALQNDRPCVPSFHDGARAQAVMDTALRSVKERRWLDVPA